MRIFFRLPLLSTIFEEFLLTDVLRMYTLDRYDELEYLEAKIQVSGYFENLHCTQAIQIPPDPRGYFFQIPLLSSKIYADCAKI